MSILLFYYYKVYILYISILLLYISITYNNSLINSTIVNRVDENYYSYYLMDWA